MIKVCFIHPYALDAFKKRSVGGTELQIYHISREIAKEEGMKAEVITNRDKSEKDFFEGVKLVKALGNVDTWPEKFITAFNMLYHMYESDAEVYFSSSDNMIPGLVSFYCLITGSQHIHRTVHERQCDGSLIREDKIRGVVNNLGLRFSDFIFAQSQQHKNLLKDWFNPPVGVLPNLFPIANEGNVSSSSNQEDHILWVGRRVRWKNPEMFIDLARRFKSQKFVMISPCTGDDQEYYERIDREAEKLDNLELIERVPRTKIGKYYREAKILVNTSEKEGFPNTFIEAGKAATPILTYKVDPDNYIREENCGINCQGDAGKLFSSIDVLVNDKDQIKTKGRNSRRYVEQNHDIEEEIHPLIDKIENLT
ncbi:MAG: glycosyltransferase involved in cell wall biosynthesis [Colwellia polaris]|jgi:glycosyltransferase involved in cell wall biosynthesis